MQTFPPLPPTGHFFGLTVISEKGQAVIPVEARRALKLDKGEKLLVVGLGPDMLALVKASNLELFAGRLSAHLASIKQVIKQTKGDHKPKKRPAAAQKRH